MNRGTKGSRTSSNKVVKHLSAYSGVLNQYNPLSTTPDLGDNKNTETIIEATERQFTMSEVIKTKEEKLERKRQQRMHQLLTLQRLAQQEDLFLDKCITMAEYEQTVMAKKQYNKQQKTGNRCSTYKKTTSSKPGCIQRARNAAYTATTQFRRAFSTLLSQKRVSFCLCPESNYWRVPFPLVESTTENSKMYSKSTIQYY